jgi:hypothetical protein
MHAGSIKNPSTKAGMLFKFMIEHEGEWLDPIQMMTLSPLRLGTLVFTNFTARCSEVKSQVGAWGYHWEHRRDAPNRNYYRVVKVEPLRDRILPQPEARP